MTDYRCLHCGMPCEYTEGNFPGALTWLHTGTGRKFCTDARAEIPSNAVTVAFRPPPAIIDKDS